jgi:hypothetical protein
VPEKHTTVSFAEIFIVRKLGIGEPKVRVSATSSQLPLLYRKLPPPSLSPDSVVSALVYVVSDKFKVPPLSQCKNIAQSTANED